MALEEQKICFFSRVTVFFAYDKARIYGLWKQRLCNGMFMISFLRSSTLCCPLGALLHLQPVMIRIWFTLEKEKLALVAEL